MKRIMLKSVIAILGIVAIIGIANLCSSIYITRNEITVVDTVQSEDGVYEVVLQSAGEPKFPFGSASGQLVLSSDDGAISKTDFEIANDGASLSAQAWSVMWYDNYVEVILSGEEQYDELVTLYYDGQVERCRLATRYGIKEENTSDNVVDDATDIEDDLGYEIPQDEQQVNDGYQAIYALLSDSSIDNFEVYYGATESSSRCVLSEDENTVDYLVYNGKSQNEKCGLYVHYQSKKNIDGTWSDANGIIVDIYAYVYENGDVVSGGKTHWGDIGSEVYREVTGEK